MHYEKLQLSIRSFHLGISVAFPAMSKQELIDHWLSEAPAWMVNDIRLMFDAAILRLIPDYISSSELASLRNQWIQNQTTAVVTSD
ncbi:hypothetical protein [Paenibacillus sp. LBL]|uniref:hypothetical protein n=1 Tax=Paenibacillus sp. LBL TaxID=2940563 RepID=UPI00247318F8|nr:hypothetical protein [Paenibacillus sp. LBL]